jgi:hypothetical protein
MTEKKLEPRPCPKIIQISTSQTDGASAGYGWLLFALCDDGSVWECGTGFGWQKMPPIPQETT